MKTCNECTKCCEGWLTGEVFGKKFYPGTPCQFVKKGEGCKIYEMRPQHPCQSFECLWKIDDSMPDSLHPNLTNGIVHREVVGGVSVVAITHTGDRISPALIEYVKEYSVNNKKNLVVNDLTGSYAVTGSNAFKQLFALVKDKKVV